MSSRLTLRKSSDCSGENCRHFLFPDPYSYMEKHDKNSKINSSITLTLRFKRLLLKFVTKRDTIFYFSVLLYGFVLFLSYQLNQPNVSIITSTRSIHYQDLSRFYSTSHPVTIKFVEDPLENQSHMHHTKKEIKGWTKEDENRQQDLWNEEKYDHDRVVVIQPYEGMPECKPMHKWQTAQYPTCTVIHEQRLNDKEFGKFLANGSFRQTFEIHDRQTDSPVAMKTIREKPDKNRFTPYFMDRHRVDALIYERTSASPWITDIYGFCGLSGLFEFAGGGTLKDTILDRKEKGLKPLSRIEKLTSAVQATSAIADLHTIDSINGYSAMMHGDLKLDQFVRIGNRYKLNDFNRGHLMYWDEMKQESCPYAWDEGHNGHVSSFCLHRKNRFVPIALTLYCILSSVSSTRGIQS